MSNKHLGPLMEGIFMALASNGEAKQTDGVIQHDDPQKVILDTANATAGIKYDSGKPSVDLLSPIALFEIAKVMDFGKKKYSAHNWRGGIAWSRLLGAALRHLLSFLGGEDKDPETGYSHLAHLGCCVMFLLEYEVTHKELDDRYRSGGTP